MSGDDRNKLIETMINNLKDSKKNPMERLKEIRNALKEQKDKKDDAMVKEWVNKNLPDTIVSILTKNFKDSGTLEIIFEIIQILSIKSNINKLHEQGVFKSVIEVLKKAKDKEVSKACLQVLKSLNNKKPFPADNFLAIVDSMKSFDDETIQQVGFEILKESLKCEICSESANIIENFAMQKITEKKVNAKIQEQYSELLKGLTKFDNTKDLSKDHIKKILACMKDNKADKKVIENYSEVLEKKLTENRISKIDPKTLDSYIRDIESFGSSRLSEVLELLKNQKNNKTNGNEFKLINIKSFNFEAIMKDMRKCYETISNDVEFYNLRLLGKKYSSLCNKIKNIIDEISKLKEVLKDFNTSTLSEDTIEKINLYKSKIVELESFIKDDSEVNILEKKILELKPKDNISSNHENILMDDSGSSSSKRMKEDENEDEKDSVKFEVLDDTKWFQSMENSYNSYIAENGQVSMLKKEISELKNQANKNLKLCNDEMKSKISEEIDDSFKIKRELVNTCKEIIAQYKKEGDIKKKA